MTQYLIIGAVVSWAVLYSAWSLGSPAWRRAVAAQLAGWARRAGLSRERAHTLKLKLGKSGGCGECALCHGCAKASLAKPGAGRFHSSSMQGVSSVRVHRR